MASPQNYITVSRRAPDIEDYIDMVRRHRAWILGPTFAGLVIAVVVAFLWPDTFISTAVMRITPQQVPQRLVPSAVNTQMAERIQQLQTEIFSSHSLAELIQRPSLDLYKRERQRYSLEDIVQDLKNKQNPKIVPMEIQYSGQERDGERRLASAFAIQFSYQDRYKAQAMVNALVAKFTEQNAALQRAAASTTTSFLNDEVKEAKQHLDQLDAELTKFRVANQGRLPEQLQSNIQALNGLTMRLGQVNETLNRNQQNKMLLATQLQSFQEQQNLLNASAEQTGPSQAAKNDRLLALNQTITDVTAKLAAAREVLKENHPDIRSYRAQLTALEKQRDLLEKEESQPARNAAAPKRALSLQMQNAIEQNRASIESVKTQLKALDLDIAERAREKENLNRAILAYQSRIDSAPEFEQQYLGLQREYSLAKATYDDMMKRHQDSETAQNLEEHKAGATLDVLDTASLPESAADPPRPTWIGIGTAVGLMFGVMLAGLKEMKNTSLKNLKDVRAYTNLPVLSSVPLLENALLVRKKRRLSWLAWSTAAIIGIMAMSGALYYHLRLIGRT